MAAELTGRDEELALVLAALEVSPAAVILEGDAGIGKTRIWRAALTELAARGVRVLSTRTTETESRLSYAGLADILDPVLDEALAALPSPQRRALEIALQRSEPEGGPPDQAAIAFAVLGALRAASQTAPVVVAVDDVQWLDASSAVPLAYVLRRSTDHDLRFLLSRRTERAVDPLGLDLLDAGSVERLEVSPVSVGALGRIVYERLGWSLPRPTLQRLHAAAGGNPLHALELGRALGDGSRPLPPDEPLPVPSALRDLVRRRLAALPVVTREALVAASVVPRPTHDVLETILGRDSASALGPAVDAEIVELDGPAVRFAHPLYSAAVYELETPSRRAEVHGRLAELVDDPEQRARHLALATDHPDEAVADIVEDGARYAFARGSPTLGSELAAHATRLTPAAEHAARDRRRLAEVDYLFAAGDAAQADALAAALVDGANAGPSRARLLARRARIQHFAADMRASVQLLEQALAEVEDDARLRGEIEEGLVWGHLLLRHDLPAALVHARSAVAIAESRTDLAALSEALAAQSLCEFVLGKRWETTMKRALALGEHLLGVRVLRHPSFAYGYCLSCSDRLDEARGVFETLRSRAEQYGDESSMPSLLNHLTLIACLAGHWGEAAALGDECLERALASKQPPTQASVLGKLALLAARRGHVEEAREQAARSLAIAGGGRFDPTRPEQAMARGGETAVWALGFLELSLDDPEQAHRLLGPLCTSLLAAGVQEPGEIRSLPDEIEALVRLGRLDEAAALLERFEEWEARVARPSVTGALHRCRALVLATAGDDRGALASLESSAEAFGVAPLPFERAQALVALGRAQRRARQRKAAREVLTAALATFEGLGSPAWSARARSELERIGGRAPAGGELTRSERQVAELVAQGKTNKEAAAELVVSVHTIEAALTSIYRKLDIRSRTELARTLAASE